MDDNLLVKVINTLKVDEHGNGALHHAVQRRNLKLVRLLVVDIGEDPCLQNKEGIDCVESAIQLDWLEGLKFFMEHVRPGDQEYHKSLLLLAAKCKAISCTEELLKHIDINCRINDKSFIHHALERVRYLSGNENQHFSYDKRNKYISYLLEKNPEIKDNTGCLFVLSLHFVDDICEKFLSETDPNAIYDGKPLLVHVAEYSLKRLKKLIEAGADPNLQGTDGRSALFYCQYNSERFDYLLSLPNINVNIVDNAGNNVLFHIFNSIDFYSVNLCTINNYYIVVDKLIKKEININHKNKENNYFIPTAVHNKEIIINFVNRLIIEYGLNKDVLTKDVKNDTKQTPSRCSLM